MGVIQTLEQVKANLATAGNAVGSTAGAFGKAAGQYVCSLYDSHPDWVTGKNVDATGFFSSIRTSFLNEVCGLPTTSPTPPPFTGGQCICQSYKVTLNWELVLYPGQGNGTFFYGLGPISGIRVVDIPGAGDTIQVLCGYAINGVCQPDLVWADAYSVGAGSGANIVKEKIVDVYLMSGNPDNCGNPPTPSPPPPAPGDLIQNYDIDIINNDAPDVNLTVPFAFVDFAPSLDIPVNFKLELNAGGQNFTLDFGPEGVKLPDSPPVGGPPPQIIRRFDDVDRKVDDVRRKTEECCSTTNPPKTDDNFDIIDKEPEDPKEEEDIELLAYVEVLLTKKPKNFKGQSGGGNGPDVIYAGWFEFKRGTYSFPRSPLHFGSSVFKAPIGADGYAYTLYNGYEGKHTVYRFKREEI